MDLRGRVRGRNRPSDGSPPDFGKPGGRIFAHFGANLVQPPHCSIRGPTARSSRSGMPDKVQPSDNAVIAMLDQEATRRESGKCADQLELVWGQAKAAAIVGLLRFWD